MCNLYTVENYSICFCTTVSHLCLFIFLCWWHENVSSTEQFCNCFLLVSPGYAALMNVWMSCVTQSSVAPLPVFSLKGSTITANMGPTRKKIWQQLLMECGRGLQPWPGSTSSSSSNTVLACLSITKTRGWVTLIQLQVMEWAVIRR